LVLCGHISYAVRYTPMLSCCVQLLCCCATKVRAKSIPKVTRLKNSLTSVRPILGNDMISVHIVCLINACFLRHFLY